MLKYQVLDYPAVKGLDACVEFMEKEAYIDSALSKMYNIEPISTGRMTIPVSYEDGRKVNVEAVVLCWSNGIVLALQGEGTDSVDYLCYTKPKTKVLHGQTTQGERSTEQTSGEETTEEDA